MKALTYQGPQDMRISPGVYSGFLHGMLFGRVFEKRLIFEMGKTQAQRYMPELLGPVTNGKIKPELTISHRTKLIDAALGCELFDGKKDNCREVI